MTADEILLHRYSTTGDPGAFRELADRYAGLVYSIGMRVTGDRHTAEDVCQDCFVELAQKSRLVRENVAGWLHALATSRSLNAIRSRQRRTRREQAVATDGEVDAETSESHELQALIDRALNGLSDDLRLPIIHHYLQGESQQQVAERLGINQATVSRRLQRGVEQLRQRLHVFGVMTTTMAVVSLFAHGAAQAASVPVTGALTKIGLGGVGVTVAKSASGSLPAAMVFFAAAVGNVLAFLLLKGWMLLLIVVIELALLVRPPAWLRELLRAQAFGRDVVAHPMYPFQRWTWTIPPDDWKQRLVLWTFVAFTFGVTAFGDRRDIAARPGFVMAFGLMSVWFLTLAARLAWRVWQHRDRLADTVVSGRQDASQWRSRDNAIGLAVVTGVATIWLLCVPREERFAWSRGAILGWTWLAACAAMAIWALADRLRLHRRPESLPDAHLGAEDDRELQPVALRYHIVLMVCLIMAAGSCVLSAGIHLFEIVKVQPLPKGYPPYAIMASTMGIVFSLMLLRHVIRIRNQLARSAWLPLLALSITCAMLGSSLLMYGLEAAVKQSGASDEDAPPVTAQDFRLPFPMDPTQENLAREYAQEAALITIPDEQLPDDWYGARYGNGYAASVSNETEGAIRLGLPHVPELDGVTAHLSQMYTSETAHRRGDDRNCMVHAFCCESPDAARQLNEAWRNRGLCVDRLVIFVNSGTRGLRAPTSADQAPVPTLLQHLKKTRSTLLDHPDGSSGL